MQDFEFQRLRYVLLCLTCHPFNTADLWLKKKKFLHSIFFLIFIQYFILLDFLPFSHIGKLVKLASYFRNLRPFYRKIMSLISVFSEIPNGIICIDSKSVTVWIPRGVDSEVNGRDHLICGLWALNARTISQSLLKMSWQGARPSSIRLTNTWYPEIMWSVNDYLHNWVILFLLSIIAFVRCLNFLRFFQD